MILSVPELHRKHLFFLPNNMAPYQAARFNVLQDLGLDFSVATIPWKQHFRPWGDGNSSIGFELIQYDSTARALADAKALRTSATCRTLSVYGYIPPFRKLLASLAGSDIRRGIFVDTFEPQKRNPVKELYKSLFLRRSVEFIIVPGNRHVQYVNGLAPAVDTLVSPLCGSQVDVTPKDVSSRDYFICVARYSPEKNLHTLLDAFGRYRTQGGTKRLHLIGDGPQRAEIGARIQKLGLGTSVQMFEWMDAANIRRHMWAGFALVQPSHFEPYGVAIAEGMDCGLPLVVSRRCGSLATAALEYVNTLVFDPNDTDGLAGCLMRLERSPRLHSDLCAGSRAIAKSVNLTTSAQALYWFIEESAG